MDKIVSINRERERESKISSKILSTLVTLLFIGAQMISGFSTPAFATTNTWNFSTFSDYNFDNTKIEFSGGQAQLKATSTPTWYSPSWVKRKAITIDNTGNSSVLSNYQVKINVPYVSGMQANFNDIRFTDSDGSTVLNYWMDPRIETDSISATFWVKVPSIAASSTATIYMYYGNAAAVSSSNGDNTFLFFDDFSGHAAGFYQGFAKYASNPINTPTQTWEGTNQQDPKIIKIGSIYYMFYAAESGGHLNIGYATSSDAEYPYTWHKYSGNPVLTYNEQPGVDNTLVSAPLVIPMQDGSYRMYYHGYNGTNDVAAVAMATAGGFPNTWTKYSGNPILNVGAPGSWDEKYIHDEIIIPSWNSPDGFWHMMYGGGDTTGNIWRGGHATSTDGLSWTKDSLNPVFTQGPSGAFDSYGVHPVGQVIKVGSVYYMPYQGYDNNTWRIGVATTTDFVHFSKSPSNPLLIEGVSGAWDGGSVENPGVVYNAASGTLDLFYVSPTAFNGNGVGGAVGGYKIGLARATTTVTDILDPAKWSVSNFVGGGVQRWPRIISGEAQISEAASTVKYSMVSKATFNSGVIEAHFSTLGLTANYQQLNVGFGSDKNHYIEGQRIYAGSNLIRSEHAINGVYADNGGVAGSYNSGWIKVQRSGSVTNVYIKQNAADAWTLLEGNIPDTMTNLPAMLSIYDPTTANFDNVLVRNFTSVEPTISNIGSEQIIYDAGNPSMYPKNSINFASFSSFSETAVKNGGEIKYILSNDGGSTWKYYNAGWVASDGTYSQANTAIEINTNIATFPAGNGNFLFKAYLHSDGTQLVQLSNVSINGVSLAQNITGFSAATSTTSLTVPVSSFTASGNVVGYLITESSSTPAAGAAGWSVTPPPSYTLTSIASTKTIYAWIKNSLGTVSTSTSFSVSMPYYEITSDQIQNHMQTLNNIGGVTPVGNVTSTNHITFPQQIVISLGSGTTITIPSNTVMTVSSSSDFTQVNATSTVSTTDLPAGYTSAGTVQYGFSTIPITASQAVTVKISVGADYNGQTLTVHKKEAGGSSWSNFATCVVSLGLCQFTTTNFSAFSADSYSAPSNAVSGVSWAGGSYPAPGTPTDLSAAIISPTQINLSWAAPKTYYLLNVGYTIYRNGAQIATTTKHFYADTSVQLTASTTYSYAVSSYDNAGLSSTATPVVLVSLPYSFSVIPTLSISELQQQVENLISQLKLLLLKKISSIKGTLKIGSKGGDVLFMQNYLVFFGGKGQAVKNLSDCGATGYFGQLTKDALAEFQKTAGITPASGIFGSKTKKYFQTKGNYD